MIEALLTIFFSVLAVAGIIIFFLAYDALAWGLVCYKFWYWFVLPVFPTLPQIVFWQAVGLMFFIALFKNTAHQIVKKEYCDSTAQIITTFIIPWVALATGYFTYALVIPKLIH